MFCTVKPTLCGGLLLHFMCNNHHTAATAKKSSIEYHGRVPTSPSANDSLRTMRSCQSSPTVSIQNTGGPNQGREHVSTSSHCTKMRLKYPGYVLRHLALVTSFGTRVFVVMIGGVMSKFHWYSHVTIDEPVTALNDISKLVRQQITN